ncbi:hypothetical protein [Magnetospirillum sp. 15-1]|uniref:hypothetical protein n=1 Tax=Magnetospirillum sp. 15-1 TaxID=1979370 RepID=UPI0011432FC1|nr:hypothetical protein [Magnetospirillum sp. 15-1]
MIINNQNQLVRNCNTCGRYNFLIMHNYIIRCSNCGCVYAPTEHPQHDINERLTALCARFPYHSSFAMDREGFVALTKTAANSYGQVVMTDNGGGELSGKHLDVVFSYLGYAEVMVWCEDNADLKNIRMECRKLEMDSDDEE